MGTLLIQRLCKPWVCFSANKIQSLPNNSNPWFDLLLSLPISFFLSLLERLPHLTPNLSFQLCIIWLCFHPSLFCNRQLDPFQVPDVLFTYAAASGPLHSRVTAKWQTHRKPNWQPASGLHHPDKPGRHFKGVQRRPERKGPEGEGNADGAEAHPLRC